MRRATLLALLALAVPTAALANIIPFQLQIGPPITVGDFTGNSRACATLNPTTFSCSTGNYFNAVNINNPTANAPWVLNLVGPTGRIVLDITSLRPPGSTTGNCNSHGGSPGTVPCDFIGTVMAFGTSVPGGTFTDSVSGTVTRGPNVSIMGANNWVLSTLDGELGNHEGELTVDNVQFCQTKQEPAGCGDPGDGGRLRSGVGAATLLVVPEPGTLALLGTGMIGLAGIVRRRCKLRM